MLIALAVAALLHTPPVTAHIAGPVCTDAGNTRYQVRLFNHHHAKTKRPHVWQFPDAGGVHITDATLPPLMGLHVPVKVKAGHTVEVYAYATVGYGHRLIHTTLPAIDCEDDQ